MSILSDLDPQNARIHGASGTAGKWPLTGLLVLILTASAGAIYYMGSSTPEDAPPPAMPMQVNTPIANESADQPLKVASAAPIDTGAALIQRSTEMPLEEPSPSATPANAFRVLQDEGATASPTPKEKPKASGNGVKTPKEARRKVAKANSGQKVTRKSAQMENEAQKRKLSAKPAQRDIDIISAIVK